jgi:hypothetical protein
MHEQLSDHHVSTRLAAFVATSVSGMIVGLLIGLLIS